MYTLHDLIYYDLLEVIVLNDEKKKISIAQRQRKCPQWSV